MHNFRLLFMMDLLLEIPYSREFADHDGPVRLLASLFILSFIFLVRSMFLKRMVRRDRPGSFLLWRKNSTYLSLSASVILLFLVWLPSIGNILTFFSIVGTGFIIVNKEILLNLGGWFYIVIRRPFETGNRIRVGNYIGDVIDIRLQDFSMLEVMPREEGGQSTGRVLRVPNGLLFTHPLANSSMEFAYFWNEIAVKLKPDSDWKKALAILEEIAVYHADHVQENDPGLADAESFYAIRYRSVKPRVYIEYRNGGIYLNLRHLTDPRKIREDSDFLWRKILGRFEKEKRIELSEE